MIPQDDFSKNQRPHWIPFFDLGFPMPEDDNATHWLINNIKTVKIDGLTTSPSPSSPVSPQASEKSGKAGFNTFIKYLKGQHKKKKDRKSLVLEHTLHEMKGYSVCGIDEFLRCVFGEQNTPMGFEEYHDFLGLWNHLQNNGKFLPALWIRDLESEERVLFDTPLHFNNKSHLSPSSLLPLIRLIGIGGGWMPAFDSLVLCAIKAHCDYATDSECLELLEFLICNQSYLKHLCKCQSTDLETNKPLNKALLNLFKRCWQTQLVYSFSAAFWESRWWKVAMSLQEALELYVELATLPVRWAPLPKPMDKNQLDAMKKWIAELPAAHAETAICEEWIKRSIALFQYAGDSSLASTLHKEIEVGEGYFKLLREPNNNDSNDESSIVSRCFDAMDEIDQKGISHEYVEIYSSLHDALLNDLDGRSPYQMFLWRYYLYAATLHCKSSLEGKRIAASLAAQLMTEKMEANDIKLFCLSLPWMESGDSQMLAKVFLLLLAKTGSKLRQTVYSLGGLREFVAVQLACILSEPTSASTIKNILNGDSHNNAEISNDSRKNVSGRLLKYFAYSSFIFYGNDTVRKCLPSDVSEEIIYWQGILPDCAHAPYSGAVFEDWLKWIMDLNARDYLIKKDAASYLGAIYFFGQHLLNDGRKNEDDPPWTLAPAIAEVLSLEWPTKLLACEVLACLMMPYASQIMATHRDPMVVWNKLQDLVATVAGILQTLEQGTTSGGSTNRLETNRRQLSALMLEFPRCFNLVFTGINEATPVWTPRDGESDIDLAYRTLASTCLAVHFGASAAQIKLEHLKLQFSVLALQHRADAGYAMRYLFAAMERTKLWVR